MLISTSKSALSWLKYHFLLSLSVLEKAACHHRRIGLSLYLVWIFLILAITSEIQGNLVIGRPDGLVDQESIPPILPQNQYLFAYMEWL
jgi:hypothetical protein